MSVYRQPDYSVLVRCPKSGSNLLLTLNVPHIRLDDKGQMDHLLNCLMPLQTLVTDFLQWNKKCEEYSSQFISFPYNETEAAKQILGKITLKVSTKCSK